jgi:dihydropteroate synthase
MSTPMHVRGDVAVGIGGARQHAPAPRLIEMAITSVPVRAEVPGFPALGRCRVMGVVNVTPDSFSDGGRWLDPEVAVRHGAELAAQGADLVDVGGESTRPGAKRIPASEELRRVLPVVAGLVRQGVTVSIDTMRHEVARAALEAGARLVNDVSGGLADPVIRSVVGAAGVPYVVMHWRGHSARMQELATYDNVVRDVCTELSARLDEAVAAGVDREAVILDPGLGFAKDAAHNWALLAHLEELGGLGQPLLLGASRKRFLGALLADPTTGEPRPTDARDDATAAVSALAARAGVWCVRVHTVPASADAVRVAAAWAAASISARNESGGT